jgi:hypothetical protein
MADDFWGDENSPSTGTADSFWGDDTSPKTEQAPKQASDNTVQEPDGDSFWGEAGDFVSDVATQGWRQFGGAARDAIQNTYETSTAISKGVGNVFGFEVQDAKQLPEVERPDGAVGNVIREGARAGMAMIPANKALKVAGVANTALRGAGSSAIASGTVYGQDDQTASDFLAEAGLDTMLTRTFETSEDDGFWERKAKHFGEDLLLSAGMELAPYVLRGGKSKAEAQMGAVVDPKHVEEVKRDAETVSDSAREASESLSKSQEQITVPKEESEILARYKELHPKAVGEVTTSRLFNDKLVYEAAQEVVTGVRTTAEDLNRVLKGDKPKVNFEGNEGLLPGVNYRMLSNVASKTTATLETGPMKALGSAFNIYDKDGNLIRAASQTADNAPTGSKGVEEIVAPFYKAGQLDNFLNFVAAMRARKLHHRGIETPFDDEHVKEVIKEFGSKQSFRNGLREWNKYMNDMLEYRRASGLHSAEEVANIKRDNPVYIPFNKQVVKDDGTVGTKSSRNPKMRIKGSKDNLANLYQNTVRYTMDTIQASDTNRAKLSFVQMMERGHKAGAINMDNVMKEVTGQKYQIARSQIAKSVSKDLQEAGYEVSKADLMDLDSIAMAARKSSFKSSDGKVYETVFDNGKARIFEVKDPWLREQLESQNPLALPKYLSWANTKWNQARNLFSTAITHSADFVMGNAPRDALTSHVNSVTGVKAWHYPMNYVKTFTLADSYRKALNSGVGLSNRTANANVDDAYVALEQYGRTEAGRAKSAELFGKKFTPMQHSNQLRNSLNAVKRDFFGRGWRGLHEFSMRAEMAQRLGEFVNAKNVGASDQTAAFMAQEIASNFSMKGSSKLMQGYQNKVPFLRAGMNGFYRMGRKAKENPARVAAASVGVLGGADVSMWALNSQFDEYYAQDQRTRDMYYMIPNFDDDSQVIEWVASGFSKDKKPTLNQESPFYSVPKPFDYGQVGTAMVGIAESIKNKSGYQAVTAFGRSLGNIIPFTGDAIPVGVKQGLEGYSNTAWHGGEIVPSYMKDAMETTDQYRPSTDETAKILSRTLKSTTGAEVSPLMVEYLYNSLLPGIASIPVEIANEHWRSEGKGEAPISRSAEANKATDTNWVNEDDGLIERTGKNIGEGIYDAFSIFISQGTERFFADNPPKSNAYLTELYELRNKAKQIEGSDNAAEQVWKLVGGEEQELVDRMDNKKKEATRIAGDILKPVTDALTEMNDIQNIIESDPELSAEEKTERIKKIDEAKNRVARDMLRELKDMPDLDVMWDSFVPGMNKKTEGASDWLDFKSDVNAGKE